jgi:hypothetical protein
MKTLSAPLTRRLFLFVLLAGCGGGSGGADTSDATCEQTENTTATASVHPDGCAVLERDTSVCDASRTSQGLSGFWLKFSCRVGLTVTGGGDILAVADGLPDSPSNYYDVSDPCYEEYMGGMQNPNEIGEQSIQITFPATPDTSGQAMTGAVVGLALNGVPIYANFAAPGDDIFEEAETFDRCGGHPNQQGNYHYHSEPYSISYDDSNFIGVMRDGYPIYGRRDPDGSYPADLDANGGHTGLTVDSPATPVYHYHVNEQTSTGMNTAGEKQWFLTTGTYRGTPGGCTGCD